MPSTEVLVPFFIATAIFACVPGPGMLYIAALTVAAGRRAGWRSAIGFHIGGFFHIGAAAFGLSVLLKAVPTLFVVVKIAGAAYLIWLGLRYLLAARAAAPPIKTIDPSVPKALRDSIVVEVLNPKTALFYLAFLPQFTDVSASLPVWAQVIVLGVLVNTMLTISDAVLIELSGAAKRGLRASHRIDRAMRRIGGGVLVALGVNLALSQQ